MRAGSVVHRTLNVTPGYSRIGQSHRPVGDLCGSQMLDLGGVQGVSVSLIWGVSVCQSWRHIRIVRAPLERDLASDNVHAVWHS